MKLELRGKTVAVAGMGKSGLAALEVLLREGAKVRAIDNRPTPELRAQLEPRGVELVEQCDAAFGGVDLIVLSPGVPVATVPPGPARVIGEVELASHFLRGPIIGITGSNGKTTTTALTGHILEQSGIAAQVGGNIGIAPASMIGASRDSQWNVLELSSFQLETICDFHADIGVCLNVTQNHLDRHGTLDNYTNAKARLIETLRPSAHAVLNRDNEITRAFAARTSAEVVWFSMHEHVSPGYWFEGPAIFSSESLLMPVSEIRLRGMHNVENVMAAAAICRIAGATLRQIRSAVSTFESVEHRLEFVRNLGGVDYYNDSKATSVDATLKAIDAFPGGLWIILGGKDKGSDYTLLRHPLEAKAHAALLIGAAASKIASHLEGSIELIECGDMAGAVKAAHERAQAGDTVLLAPACASFDQFRSFEHRGEVFKQLVGALET